MAHSDVVSASLPRAFDPVPALHDARGSPIMNRRDRTALRTLVIATLLLWSGNFAILTLKAYLEGGASSAKLLPGRLAVTVVAIGMCYSAHLILRSLQSSFRRQLIVAILLTPLCTVMFIACNIVAATWLLGPQSISFDAPTVMSAAFLLYLFATWMCLYLAVTYGQSLETQRQRVQEIRLFAQAAQLRALHYQISPHFLFNTLNSISALVVEDRRQDAERMIQQLSDFLRTTLNLDPASAVSLDYECALQRAYLEIEKVRFPDMNFSVTIEDGIGSTPVPNLILQPIVENAVKHGVASLPGPNRVRIAAARLGDFLHILVTNDVADHSSSGQGIGLQNVRDRLFGSYGDAATLNARRVGDRSFRVDLFLPMNAQLRTA